ncbi:hypothetical protein AAC387_Pa02g4321 [Persea americana]
MYQALTESRSTGLQHFLHLNSAPLQSIHSSTSVPVLATNYFDSQIPVPPTAATCLPSDPPTLPRGSCLPPQSVYLLFHLEFSKYFISFTVPNQNWQCRVYVSPNCPKAP